MNSEKFNSKCLKMIVREERNQHPALLPQPPKEQFIAPEIPKHKKGGLNNNKEYSAKNELNEASIKSNHFQRNGPLPAADPQIELKTKIKINKEDTDMTEDINGSVDVQDGDQSHSQLRNK